MAQLNLTAPQHRGRITRRVNSTRNLLNRVNIKLQFADPDHEPNVQLEEVIDAQGVLNGWIHEVETSISDLERIDNDYSSYVGNIADPADHAAAVDEYTQYTEKADGLNDTVEDARKTLGDLKGRTFAAQQFSATIQNLIKTDNGAQPPVPPPPPTVQQHRTHVQLTPLKGETFDGRLESWLPFWEFFESEIDSLNMSEVSKFRYLRDHLKHEPLSLLSGLSVTAANYRTAVDLLKKEYGDKDRLISHLYKKLEAYSPASGNPQDMWEMLQYVEGLLRQLVSLGQQVNQSGCSQMLSTILVRKVPKHILRDMTMSRDLADRNKDWPPFEFCTNLRELLRTNQRLQEQTEQNDFGRNRQKQQVHEHPPLRSSQVFSLQNTNTLNNKQSANRFMRTAPERRAFPPTRQVTCAFCRGSHYSDKCSNYPTLNDRYNRCRMEQLCFRCLKQHTGTCTAKPLPCFYCKATIHNQALCKVKFASAPTTAPVRNTNALTAAVPYSNNKPPQQTVFGRLAAVNRNPFMNQQYEQTNESGENRRDKASINTTEVQQQVKKPTGNVRLMTATLTARNPVTIKESLTRAFFDSGSQASFVSSELVDKLHLQRGDDSELAIKTFGHSEPEMLNTFSVELHLIDAITNGPHTVTPFVVPREVIAQLNQQPEPTTEDLAVMRNMPFEAMAEQPGDGSIPIDLMIGGDYYFKFINPDNTHTLPSGLTIIDSKFGLILAGCQTNDMKPGQHDNRPQINTIMHPNQDHETTNKKPNEHDTTPQVNMVMHSNQESQEWGKSIHEAHFHDSPSPEEQFNLFNHPWDLDHKALTDISIDEQLDQEAVRQFHESVDFVDGRIQVGWGFVPNHKPIKSNFGLAKARLASVLHSLGKTPALLEKYAEAINKLHDKGIIEDAPPTPDAPAKLHYLPHHGVFNLQKTTTPVRPVFDASATASRQDVSLNDCLLKGPCQLPEIPALLVYFRTHDTVLLADIEGAFHQVLLRPEDRDCVRFIWLWDWNKGLVEGNIRVMRFTRLTMGMKESPFLLEMAIKEGLSQHDHPIANMIKERLYVDNLMMGFHNESSLLETYNISKELFATFKMNIREYVSSSPTFNDTLPPEDGVPGNTVKVLGVTWEVESDQLSLSAPKVKVTQNKKPAKEGQLTKRMIMRDTMKQYDPLGLYLPILIRAKVLIQQLFKHKYQWDDQLPDTIIKQWNELMDEINAAKNIHVPRLIPIKHNAPYMMHCFVDASKDAYAAALYITVPTDSGNKTNLLMARNSLAPSNKTLTIPRLELMAAGLGHKLIQYVIDSKQLHTLPSEIHMFIDSQVVLNWIRTSTKLGVFVENRVAPLRENNYRFHYVESSQNPADLATRYATASELQDPSHIWWKGPAFLATPCTEWPVSEIPEINDETLAEIARAKEEKQHLIHLPMNEVIIEPPNDMQLIDPLRFSSLTKLRKALAFCFRFIRQKVYNKLPDNRKQRMTFIHQHANNIQQSGPVNARGLELASIWLERQAQHEAYANEIELLNQGQSNHLIQSLRLTLDQHNRLVSKHRQTHAHEGNTALIMLPKQAQYTKLLIQDTHQQRHHAGVQDTLAAVRNKYWVPAGRATVKHAIQACTPCKRSRGAPYELPPMPDLPPERVNKSSPFTYVGCDYAGPIMTREHDQDIGVKRWVAVFTCLSTRAVHLELVANASAWAFCMALRKMIARRGVPKRIYSDNGTQLVFTEKLLRENWVDWGTDQSLLQYCASHGIEWEFNIPKSSWSLGVIERIIGITKTSLKAAIGRRLLTTDELRVLLTETEAIVNTRPITYVYADRESYAVLRPMDFLMPGKTNGIATWDIDLKDPDFEPTNNPQRELAEQWTHLQTYLDRFWQLWNKEYLVSLRENMRTTHKHGRLQADNNPQLGDVVLINDEPLPRGAWRVGRIVQLYDTSCDRPRAVKLQLPNGTAIDRPINLLHPFETSSSRVPKDKRQQPADANIDISEDESDTDSELQYITQRARGSRTTTKQINALATTLTALTLNTMLPTARAMSTDNIIPPTADLPLCVLLLLPLLMVLFVIHLYDQRNEDQETDQDNAATPDDDEFVLAPESKNEIGPEEQSDWNTYIHKTPESSGTSTRWIEKSVKSAKCGSCITISSTISDTNEMEKTDPKSPIYDSPGMTRKHFRTHRCTYCTRTNHRALIKAATEVPDTTPIHRLKRMLKSCSSLEMDTVMDQGVTMHDIPDDFTSPWNADELFLRATQATIINGWHITPNGDIAIRCANEESQWYIYGYDEHAARTANKYPTPQQRKAAAKIFWNHPYGKCVHYELHKTASRQQEFIDTLTTATELTYWLQEPAFWAAHSDKLDQTASHLSRLTNLIEKMQEAKKRYTVMDEYPPNTPSMHTLDQGALSATKSSATVSARPNWYPITVTVIMIMSFAALLPVSHALPSNSSTTSTTHLFTPVNPPVNGPITAVLLTIMVIALIVQRYRDRRPKIVDYSVRSTRKPLYQQTILALLTVILLSCTATTTEASNNNTCRVMNPTVQFWPLKGWTTCTSRIRLTLTCTTTNNQSTQASLQCDMFNMTLPCSPNGTHTIQNLFLPTIRIKDTCAVTCNDKTTYFGIEADAYLQFGSLQSNVTFKNVVLAVDKWKAALARYTGYKDSNQQHGQHMMHTTSFQTTTPASTTLTHVPALSPATQSSTTLTTTTSIITPPVTTTTSSSTTSTQQEVLTTKITKQTTSKSPSPSTTSSTTTTTPATSPTTAFTTTTPASRTTTRRTTTLTPPSTTLTTSTATTTTSTRSTSTMSSSSTTTPIHTTTEVTTPATTTKPISTTSKVVTTTTIQQTQTDKSPLSTYQLYPKPPITMPHYVSTTPTTTLVPTPYPPIRLTRQINETFLPAEIRSGREGYLKYEPVVTNNNTHFEIQVWFKSYARTGIVLHAGNASKYTDYFTVYVYNGFPHFYTQIERLWDDVQYRYPITVNRYHVISLKVHDEIAYLQLDTYPFKRIRLPTGRGKPNYNYLPLYIGGANKRPVLGKIVDSHALSLLSVIQRVVINSRTIYQPITQATELRHIEAYYGLPCYPNPCGLNGTCLGHLHWHKCICDTGLTMTHCNVTQSPNIDYLVNHKGTSFLNHVTRQQKYQENTRYELRFKTIEQHGLLIFESYDNTNSSTFIGITIHNGSVIFAFQLNSHQPYREYRSTIPVSDGQWHTILFARHKAHSYLIVDNESPIVAVGPEEAGNLKSEGTVCIGSCDNVPQTLLGKFTIPFIGCMTDLKINNVAADMNAQSLSVTTFDKCENDHDLTTLIRPRTRTLHTNGFSDQLDNVTNFLNDQLNELGFTTTWNDSSLLSILAGTFATGPWLLRKINFTSLIFIIVASQLIMTTNAQSYGPDGRIPDGALAPKLPQSAAECQSNDTYAITKKSESCVTEGYIIKEQHNGLLCWKLAKCDNNAHLQPDGTCGARCPCPNGFDHCVNDLANVEQPDSNLIDEVIRNSQPQYCSMTPSSSCSRKPMKVSLPKILLANDQELYVQNLRIVLENTITDNKFTCAGKGRRTGAPTFCDKHPCAPTGSELCIYEHKEAAWFVDPSGNRIPIKAWTYKNNVEVYGTKSSKHDDERVCITCKVNCIKAGAEVYVENDTSLVEVCVKPICYSVMKPNSTFKFLFAPELMMNDYVVTIQAWKYGMMYHSGMKTCPAQPYCEQIDCYFCIARLINPQCTSHWGLLVIFAAVYFSAITLWISGQLLMLFLASLRCGYKTTKCLINAIRRLIRKIQRKGHKYAYVPLTNLTRSATVDTDDEDSATDIERSNPPLIRQAPRQPRRHFSFFTNKRGLQEPQVMLTIIILNILAFAPLSQACSEVISFKATRESCTVKTGDSDPIMDCVINQVTLLTLVPAGQKACLLMTDPDGSPLGSMTVEIKAIAVRCVKRHLFFTRSFTMKTASVLRCSGAGSCTGTTCIKLKTNDTISELSNHKYYKGIFKLPGHSRCVMSGGFWHRGCFLADESCLFYRTYAAPTSTTEYSVFECSTWHYEITVELIREDNTGQTRAIKTIIPTYPLEWEGFKFNLQHINLPPSNLWAQRFITDHRRIAMVTATPAGKSESGVLGQLQCHEPATANTTNEFESCILNRDSCECQERQGAIHCICDEIDIESLMNNEYSLLPLHNGDVLLEPIFRDNTTGVEAILKAESSLTLLVDSQATHMKTRADINRCEVDQDQITVTGCAQCLTGAHLQFKCTSDRTPTMGHFDCDGVRFNAHCTPDGHQNRVSVHWAKQVLNEQCHVHCNGGTSAFSITGQLSIIAPTQTSSVVHRMHALDYVRNPANLTMFLNTLKDLLSFSWLETIITAVIAIVCVIATIILSPTIIRCVSRLIKLQRVMIPTRKRD